jgi:hypothetical protein
MAPLLIGATLSGCIHFVCYETTLAFQMNREKDEKMHRIQVAAFSTMTIIVVGALWNLPKLPSGPVAGEP